MVKFSDLRHKIDIKFCFGTKTHTTYIIEQVLIRKLIIVQELFNIFYTTSTKL